MVFAISLCFNLFIVMTTAQNTSQKYDYKTVCLTSFQAVGDYCEKSTVFCNWAMYPIYLKFVNKKFCQSRLTGIALNALIISLVSAMVYSIAKNFVSKKTALLGSLFFASWPDFFEYIPMLSPEFVFLFLATFAGFLLCRHTTENASH